VTTATLSALQSALAFEAVGNRAGNVTIGRGTLDGRTVHVALVDNHLASGSIGTIEAKRLEAVLRIAAVERSPFVIYLDSAGAKVSEGLGALGAFRRLFRAALDAAVAGVPMAAVLGNNCYGGASMVAHLARQRLFAHATRLSMSGPSVIAAAAGTSALDETFKAMAEASLSAAGRAKASSANRVLEAGEDITGWLREALAPAGKPLEGFHMRHEALGARVPKIAEPPGEGVQRKELERMFPQGYEAQESEGLVTGIGRREGRTEALLGLMSRRPVGAERAWRFAQHAWTLAEKRVPYVHVLLDCESHAARLDDERLVLSEFIVGMSLALTALRLSGAHVEMTIVDRAGGGVYVALAAPATHVGVVYGAHVQVLPGAAIAAILGDATPEPDNLALAAEAVQTGVADAQVKLGIIETL
jgi:acetyl-CoA carboxylase beta subunit